MLIEEAERGPLEAQAAVGLAAEREKLPGREPGNEWSAAKKAEEITTMHRRLGEAGS
jgi:hypothetical protein